MIWLKWGPFFLNGGPLVGATVVARQKSKQYDKGHMCQFSRFWKNLNQKALSLLTITENDCVITVTQMNRKKRIIF